MVIYEASWKYSEKKVLLGLRLNERRCGKNVLVGMISLRGKEKDLQPSNYHHFWLVVMEIGMMSLEKKA